MNLWLPESREFMKKNPPPGPGNTSEDRLQSWKEIAGYLRFGVRTVQRWEETEAMPVHRRVQDRRSTVFAFKRELDEWYENRKETLTELPEGGVLCRGDAL